MRSRDVNEGDPDDADAEEDDPVLVLDLSESSERRGSESGGTPGDDDDEEEEGPPRREGSMFAIERCARIEGVGAIVRVGAGEGVGAPR